MSDRYEIVGRPIVLNYRNGYGYWIGNALLNATVSREPLTECHATPEDALMELGALVTHCGPAPRSRNKPSRTRDDI